MAGSEGQVHCAAHQKDKHTLRKSKNKLVFRPTDTGLVLVITDLQKNW